MGAIGCKVRFGLRTDVVGVVCTVEQLFAAGEHNVISVCDLNRLVISPRAH